jgi:hypothetical protein
MGCEFHTNEPPASLYDAAEGRVESEPRLQKHADTILYDWPEGDEHWNWVCTAAIDEIVDWAETVGKS